MIRSPFIYETNPGRILFGAGSLSKLPDEAARLGIDRLLVITTPGHVDRGREALSLLGTKGIGLFAQARMHTPIEVTERVCTLAAESRADGIVAIGGGSTIGLSKALALRTDLPQIVVPTTYAGSEVTPILGETREGVKRTQRSSKVLPEVVIYDVALTLSLPIPLSAASGLNAIAHAAEALYARDCNPLIAMLAEEGIRALVTTLPQIARDPHNENARSDALYGSWLCGTCLAAVSMALHHKLCHALGGVFDLPHAGLHAVILPHALAYNLSVSHEARRTLSRAVGTEDPADALFKMAGYFGVSTSLRELGMPESGIDRATDIAVRDPYWNPRPVEKDAVRELIARAWTGAPPKS